MGYFSNGTEGSLYQEQYCSRCVHDEHNDCPVWLVHMLYNYEDADNPDSILHILIPLDKNGNNEQCKLFVKKPHDA